MKKFLIKCLITYYAQRGNVYLGLLVSVICTIIFNLRGNKEYAQGWFYSCVILFAIILVFSTAFTQHRNKYKQFKVYFSFSEERIPELAKYISDYIKPACTVFNIDFYDFRDHERIDFFDETAVCKEIEKNLADSDIFLRFIDFGLEPNRSRHVNKYFNNMRINPKTGNREPIPDYSEYEVNISYDRFGFTNCYNRFQLVATGVQVSPMEHVSTIYVDIEETALNFALHIVYELISGYRKLQSLKQLDPCWNMREQINI